MRQKRLQKCRDNDGRACFRNNFKLEEEVTLVLDGVRCRANKRRRTSFCQRQRGMSIDFHETKNPKAFWEAVEYILNNFRISIHILSNGMDSFDVTLVWSDYMDGGTNKVKTSRQGLGGDGHLLTFILVLKY